MKSREKRKSSKITFKAHHKHQISKQKELKEMQAGFVQTFLPARSSLKRER